MENMLNREIRKDYGFNAGASLAGGVVALILGVVLIIGVAVPITTDVVDTANLSGTDATIAAIIPTLILLIPVVMVAAML